MSILMFDEARAESYCSHCTLRLPVGPSCRPVVCPRACGAAYCSEACQQDAWWAHHEVLCPAENEAWAAFEAHARECANEYYILAARALASLRHGGSVEAGADAWQATPWASYAARPWWETMRRPNYSGSSTSGGSSSSRSSRSNSCTSSAGCNREAGKRRGGCEGPPSGTKAEASKERQQQERAESDGKDSDAGSSSPESSDCSSLDRFFVARVREQTAETADLLREALARGALPTGGVAEALLSQGAEGFGRLVGLLRVNALSVQSQVAGQPDGADSRPPPSTEQDHVVKGMAIYAVTSAMNHAGDASCFAASDPGGCPRRCLIQTSRHVAAGEELHINYLEGAPFDDAERQAILRCQYGIP